MQNQGQEEANNPNYGYINQNMGDEDIAYPDQLPMENMEYQQNDPNGENAQYSQQYSQEELPPIYTQQIQTVKETNEHQVKYFEPIELSEGQDVAKYLQSGQLMQQIAPKIMALKQETQKSGDPSVHTEVTFDLKQNNAIYNNPNQDGNEDEEQQQNPMQNSQNSQQMQGNLGGNQEGPNGIKYSSILPPKIQAPKIVTIDQYGNRHEEDQNEEEEQDEEIQNQQIQNQQMQIQQMQAQQMQNQQIQNQQMQNDEVQNGGDDPMDNDEQPDSNQQQNELQQQQLYQQQLYQQQLQQKQLQQQQLQQQQLQQQQLQQQQLQQQQLQQQQLQQQQLQQQQLQQQQLYQQKLQQQKLQQQQLQQQQLQQQRLQQQQLLQTQQISRQRFQQQQGITPQMRPSHPSQNSNPLMHSTSGSINPNFQRQNPHQLVRIQGQISKSPFRNPIRNNLPRKDPIVQKAIKIFGTLRPRYPNQNVVSTNDQVIAAQKIQKKWRSHFFKKLLELKKPQLRLESENFLKAQYELCDKAGPVASDDDFSLLGWKKFYPPNDQFFNFKKGFVIPYGIKIRHPNDPKNVSVYEGDINIKNQKHGFGRLTTVKSVFLGEWRNDQFTGWGRETRRSGKVLEGKYINGVVEGKGILKNAKGNTYIGDFSNSKRHGKGVLDTHKVHYEGEFKNDKLSGKGRISFKNEGHYYEGDFDNNEINGYGTFKWKNGDSYTGQMMNGKMHGKGVYRYNNGTVFEGTYANGMKQGKGKTYNINSITNKYNDPKGLNMSGMTVNNNMKFGGGK